jgi:two-component system response regulator HupR/HoxA
MDRLTACEWRGNVRELENEIERIVALAGRDEELVSVEMLSEHVRGAPFRPASGDAGSESVEDWDLNRAVDALKRRMITLALRDTGNKTRASERLGIPRQSLQKMMKRLTLGDDDVKG